ncbi:hypothetical protein HBI56_094080 [Parastagonospora nodorum]|uniref:C2H2-type domain-containing protein n=1 Tax=Phaeosphaeria nodorum (strain SN15 / ATCC MYA-4574 / FGSC 10173) TaxID=321614 RepID=A0A7U2F3S3_PHANO|nr:hypothetical protein HBH56_089370 [Parastagonospora nodorum]QRC98138.1 hypothetical protein JI435_042350 [Parastagonospora nodorum SN15]KAH3936476.1 hypothetical protein HBH54_024010 [Parastagonospora nodorum]KAH3945773.1 hypothetical protein HBH53_141110 [Parastagonospora nodorum]KAH3966223.1 hypothetical protein HBH51_144260 [Parastagonospora nodorum]
MAMAVDRQQTQMSNMGYDPSMRYPPPPHFTNPWVSGASQQQLYSTSIAPNVSAGLDASTQRPTSIAIPYHGLQVTAPPLGQDLMARGYTSGYAASASPNNQTYAPTSAPYSQVEYGSQDRSSYPYQDASRRSSHPMNAQQPPRSSFSEALDASRGMVSLSQSDITPRNIYGSQGTSRSSTDSYGFPSSHSAHSSISSASYGHNGYYAGDGSVTDYSSAGESVDLASSRTLPRPNALLGASMPPAPQSMMSQFSSKVSSSSQKKHKCKICDKRFTRPSSLQTHMYSHTGEKPFACEVDGCGRHFSVVSNLRRHRKVHKNEGGQDHPSPEDA